ncbi:MAG: ATP-dependent helicase, partial [Candidatus Accumulibacter sp.]|nr:ATP-dependent helicase [Accumulibacter sp.]
MADLLARYARLSADEQRILRVLSVICEPVGRPLLQQILEVLGWRDQGGAPLSRLLSTTLHHRLIADGLIEGPENGLSCHPDLCEMATRETVADGTFATIIVAGERCFPIPTPKPGYWPGEARRLRMLRNALYAGREDEVLEVLGIGADTPLARVPYGQALPLLQVFLRQPDADWI